MRSFPPNYLVPSPNTMSRSSEPFRSSRPPSRASVAATFLVFVLTLSAGTPGFAQNPAPAVENVYFSGNLPLSGDTFGLGDAVTANVTFSKPVVVTGDPGQSVAFVLVGTISRAHVFRHVSRRFYRMQDPGPARPGVP